MDYGARLKFFIDRAGTTPNALAKRISVDPSTIYKIVANDSKPSLPLLEKMCVALGITMAEFFADDEAYKASAADLLKRFIAHFDNIDLPPENKKALDKLKCKPKEEQEKTVYEFIKAANRVNGTVEYQILDEKDLLHKFKSLPPKQQEALRLILDSLHSSRQ